MRKLVRALNPEAKLVEADHSQVPLSAVLDTGLFEEGKAEQHPLWAKELYGFADHAPESETYGIESFVYRARRPFHPARFRAFLNEEWPGVVRAKGHFWLATRPDWVGEMSQAGSQVTSQALGRWWSAIPKARWPLDNPSFQSLLNQHWDETWGDRRQELVFIGIGMDEAALRRRLDSCLVPEVRFQPKIWAKLPDPFPAWGERQAA